eukprot:11044443-Alexandrium_andersonii.AAC.1
MPKDCADCGLGGLAELELVASCDFATSDPERPSFVGRIGICANNGAERPPPPRELRGPILRPLLGPHSSRFER